MFKKIGISIDKCTALSDIWFYLNRVGMSLEKIHIHFQVVWKKNQILF